MFEKGFVDYKSPHYVCSVKLNIGEIVCSYDAISSIQNNKDEFCYLNATMAIDKDHKDGKYYMSINGPDGGIYYKTETDLTDNEFSSLLDFVMGVALLALLWV